MLIKSKQLETLNRRTCKEFKLRELQKKKLERIINNVKRENRELCEKELK